MVKKSDFPKRNTDLDLDSFPIILAAVVGILIITALYGLNARAEETDKLKAEPIPEKVEIIEETVVIEEKAEKETISDRDILAMVVMAEAGSEKFIGKVAVAEVVLNRARADQMTVEEVVTSPSQFSYPYYGTVSLACYEAVDYAMDHRNLFPRNMLYFRNTKYHNFGTPYEQIGNHYFSTEGDAEWDNETLGKKD